MTLRRSSRTVSVWVLTTMPSAHGVVHDAGTPLPPSTSTRHMRQEPNALSESVAQSLGMVTPASVAARRTDVPAGHVDLAAVDGDGHRLRHGLERHGSPGCRSRPRGPRCSAGRRSSYGCSAPHCSKSSGKCLIALCTGIGVSPPIAHSDPLVMVSHRSSSSTRLAETSCPAMIRSMVSTPRVDPTRQGVHLPQDSIGAELHREARHPRHVDGVVEHHDAAVTEHRAGLGERLVVHGDVEAGRGHVGAERSADLRRADRTPGQRAAAVVLDELTQADAEGQLDDAALLDVAGELEDLGAAGAAGAQLGVRRAHRRPGSSAPHTASARC